MSVDTGLPAVVVARLNREIAENAENAPPRGDVTLPDGTPLKGVYYRYSASDFRRDGDA